MGFTGLLLVAALTGCGGSGNSDGAGVEAALRHSALSHDPSKCTRLMTADFRAQDTGKTGKDALAVCEEEAEETKHDTESVTVSAVVVEGASATAEITFVGGTFGGQTLLVALVKAGDSWKLDQVVRIAKFDRPAFLAGVGVSISDKGEASPDQGRCIVGRLGRKSQREIEAVFVNRSEAASIALARACPSGAYGGTDEEQIERAVQALALDKDPANCFGFATQNYLEEDSGQHGAAALETCVQGAEDPALGPESAVVSELQVDGSSAAADVALSGKGYGSQTIALGFTREYGHWKVDAINRLVAIDRSEFTKGVLEGLRSNGTAVDPAVSACVRAKVLAMSLRQLEATGLRRNLTLAQKLFGPCAEVAGEAPAPS